MAQLRLPRLPKLHRPREFIAADSLPGRVDLDEKAKLATDDPFESFGIEVKAEGELDVADYRDMMTREAQVKAAITLKILARLSSGYDIVPASGDEQDVEIADFITTQLNDMRGTFSGFLRRAMRAMAFGMTIHEIVLRPIESGPWRGKIGLRALKWKRPENFRVKCDEFGNVTSLQQRSGNDWIDLPPEYFVVYAYEHEGDFKGKSDLRAAYRWFKSKELVDTIWNTYLEKFATPTPKAMYPKGASKSAQQEMLNGLRRLHTTNAIVAPQGWDLGLLEASRQGQPGYEAKIKYCDRMIARAILLPTLLLDEGEKGAYALGQQHADNFTWVLDALGEEVAEEIVEEQLIRPLVAYNFDTEAFPKFEWRPYQGVDLDAMSDAVERLINAEVVDPDEAWIREKLDLPPRDEAIPRNRTEPAEESNEPSDTSDAEVDTEGEASDEATMTQAVELATETAQKFDAPNVRQRLDDVEQRAVESMTATLRAMLVDLKKKMRRKKVIENNDYQAVDKLTISRVGELRQALDLALAESVMMGASDALTELRKATERTGEDMPELPDEMGLNFTAQPEVEEPVEFATTRQQVVESFKGKVPIQRALLAQYGRESYTITGVLRDDVLAKSKRVIQKGIRRGASYAQVEAELAKLFDPYLSVPGAVEDAVAQPHRVHNIVRTNMAEAYNSGRMNLFRSPSVGDFIVAYEYSAVLDDRTTEFCRSWDGAILRADSNEWGQVLPPNHYQCRSVLIPITRGERFKETAVPRAKPAAGFEYSCGCGSI